MLNVESRLKRKLLRQKVVYRQECLRILDSYACAIDDRETLIALLTQQCGRQLRVLEQTAPVIYDLWRKRRNPQQRYFILNP
jgi:hypothetical protein